MAPDRAVAEPAGPEVPAPEPAAGEPAVPVVPEAALAGPGRVAAARALA